VDLINEKHTRDYSSFAFFPPFGNLKEEETGKVHDDDDDGGGGGGGLSIPDI